MIEIGDYNTLKIVRSCEYGLILDGGEAGDILMPKKFTEKHHKIDTEVEVFVYRDSEDRLVATKEEPYACVDEFAVLQVNAVNNVGAFLDWGLPKDLLVPHREQETKMQEGMFYPVFIYLDDKTDRLVASSRLGKFLNSEPCMYEKRLEVELLIINQNEVGYQGIVNGQFKGILYRNETFNDIERGTIHTAYVRQVRSDNKIDLSLQKIGYDKIDDISQLVIDKLKKEGGFLALGDKTDPEVITRIFNISKKSYKKAIGDLYKKGIIAIEKDGIKLQPEPEPESEPEQQ